MMAPPELRGLGIEGRVARLLPAEALFTVVVRRCTLPPYCGALVWSRDEPPRVFSGGETIERNSVVEALVYAAGKIAVTFSAGPLPSRDGYDVFAEATIDVSVIGERPELTALRRELLPHPGDLTVERIADRFGDVVRAALGGQIARRDAASLLRPADDAEIDAALSDALRPELFAAGLSLGRTVRVVFRSPAWEAARQEEETATLQRRRIEAQRQIREAVATARERHLAELETLLQRVEGLAARQRGLRIGELIRTFAPAERGELYQGLLAISPVLRRTEAILAVAGGELLGFDPSQPDPAVSRFAAPGEAGPLRSVRVVRHEGEPAMLVGAANGVHWFDRSGGVRRTYLFDPPRALRGGVNAATIAGGRLLATHSEVGLIVWLLNGPRSPTFPLKEQLAQAETIRDVQTDVDGNIWLAAGYAVMRWRPEDRDAGPAVYYAPDRVECLTVAESEVFAGLRDGRIVRLASGEGGAFEVLRPATRDAVHSLCVLTAGGVPRLLVADGRPWLDLVVVDDSYRTEYRAGESLRWGLGGDDCITAVNERRDRLYVWSVSTPESPAVTVHLGRLTGHSIQDVAALRVDARPPDPAETA